MKGDWQAALEVLNLTDKLYYINVFDLADPPPPLSAGEVTATPGPPREIAFSVKHTL